MMNADQPTNERHARGQEVVEEFLHRFAEKADYRALACHAALPLMLTPELLKYLRHEFLPHVSWVAEVDLLLSKLCDEAAEGVYVMKRDARAYLIRQMREDEALGETRIEVVNRMLIERLDYLARNHPAILQHEWRTQRLSAMLYVTEQRDEAARALAEAIYQCLTGGVGEAGKAGAIARQTELARLTRLVREEAANLQGDYPDLARLAQLIGQILADRSHRVVEDLRASGQLSQQFQLPGVAVRAPLLEYLAAQGVTITRDSKVDVHIETVGVPDAVQLSGFKYSCYLNYHVGSAVSSDFVSRFNDALTRELSSGTKKSIFIASRKLESSPFYSEWLTRSLYESACYVVLWAPVDSGNESLERELESARWLEERRFRLAGESLKNRGLILPVILRSPELAPESLRNIPWVDFSKAETSPRWFITRDTKDKIRSIAEFVLDRCREAERIPEAFANPQNFALQVEAADLMRQAHDAMRLGQYGEARDKLDSVLKLHRSRQDRHGEILALNDLGEVSDSTGNLDQALRYYAEALEIARLAESRPHIAMLLDKLGLLYAAAGRFEPALSSYQGSLEIFRELGDKNGEATVLGNLGRVYADLGDVNRVIEFYEQALIIAREIGDRRGEGNALDNLGLASLNLGEAPRAREYFTQQMAIAREIGDRIGEGSALEHLSQSADELGDHQQAISYAEAALAIFEELGLSAAEGLRERLAQLRKLSQESATVADRVETQPQVEHKARAVAKEGVEIFFSYSHQDEGLRDELEKHLSLLKRRKVVAGWHNRRISPGKEWEGEINTHLEKAQIVLLLISPDFIASDYCYDVEMRRALERHHAGESCVIPVILRAVSWENAPFGNLQTLPSDGHPVTSWSNQDEAFRNVAEGIKKIANELSGKDTASNMSGFHPIPTHPETTKPRSKKEAHKESKSTSSTGAALSVLEIVSSRLGVQLDKASERGKLKAYAETVKAIHDLLLSNPPLSFAKRTIETFEDAFNKIIVGLHELSDVERGIGQARSYMLKARGSIGIALAKFDAVKSRSNALTECFVFLDKALNYLEPLVKEKLEPLDTRESSQELPQIDTRESSQELPQIKTKP